MYSAIAKITRAFFDSVVVAIVTAIVFVCFVLCILAVIEILLAAGHLPHWITNLYLAMGGI